MPSALWLFAHRALSPAFHTDPNAFVQTLDGDRAPAFLERLWTWSAENGEPGAPPRPPLRYDVHRLPNGVMLTMHFHDVTKTGEPWWILFAVKDGGYARMFLLENSEYSTEREGRPTAIVCESAADGKHVNFGNLLHPHDEAGFVDVVRGLLAKAAAKAAGDPAAN